MPTEHRVAPGREQAGPVVPEPDPGGPPPRARPGWSFGLVRTMSTLDGWEAHAAEAPPGQGSGPRLAAARRGDRRGHRAPAYPRTTRPDHQVRGGPTVMINVLILLAGVIVLGVSLAIGILLPLGRVTPGRPGAAIPRAHVFRGIVGVVIGAFILVAGLSAPFVEVPAGNVGVVTNFGSVQAGTLEPGLHIVIPIVQHVAIIDTRVQPHQFQEIDAASAEYQTVKLTGVMNYHVDGQFASDLYQRVGTDFASKVIDPAFNDFIKTVVPDVQGRPDPGRPRRDPLEGQGGARRQPLPVPHHRRRHLHRQHRLQQRVPGRHRGQAGRPAAGPDRAADPRPEEDPGRPGRRPGAGPGRFERQARRGSGGRHHRAGERPGHGQPGAGRVAVGPDPAVPVHPEARPTRSRSCWSRPGNASIFDLKGLLGQAAPTASPAP